jgi:hypothetical protein
VKSVKPDAPEAQQTATPPSQQAQRDKSGGNGAAGAPTPAPEKLELSTLKDLSVGALTKIAKGLDVPATGMRRS